MSNGLKSPTPNVVRVRLQVLCNFHAPALRAGDDRLRAAMAEYAATCIPSLDREVLFRGSYGKAGGTIPAPAPLARQPEFSL